VFERRGSKTKAITLSNYKRHKQHNEPSERQASTCNRRQAQNDCEHVGIGFGFTFDWLRKWGFFCFVLFCFCFTNRRAK